MTKSNRDSKLIQLLMWLSLVSVEHLGSNASNIINPMMIEKLKFDITRQIVLTRGK